MLPRLVDTPSWWPDLASLPTEVRQELEANLIGTLGPLRTRYCPYQATDKQEAFLRLNGREVFYGGAAGPGKSTALLMAALQYADVPGYKAMIIRRTLTDLELPGSLVETASEWLNGQAHWHGNKRRWTFPSGASLQFGYLKSRNSQYRYKSTEFQFIGFDELTEFEEAQYTYLFSRLRRPKDSTGRYPASPDGVHLSMIPLRMRSASNPGGPGHDWVYDRFIDAETRADGARFLPALMDENPHLDLAEYEEMLDRMGEVERRQLRLGDWDVIPTGSMFKADRIRLVDEAPARVVERVRWWDMAATGEDDEVNRDADYTVGLLLALLGDGSFLVEDIVRGRWSPGEVDEQLTATAICDLADYGRGGVTWWIGQEPGSSGKAIIPHYRSRAAGVVVRARTEGGGGLNAPAKVVRARPAAADSEHGKILMVRSGMVRPFLRELAAFPGSGHDDQVDALSGAHGVLSKRVLRRLRGGSAAKIQPRRVA